MTKIIGVDIDGVVADLLPEWVRWYNMDYEDELDWKSVNKWSVHEFVKEDCGKNVYKYIANPRIYDNVEPIENSVWGVKKLRDMGYTVYFITHTPAGCEGRKYKWLNDNGFEVKPEEYYEASDKSPDKSLFATDFLIDDKDKNVEHAHGQGIVFTQEYNKELIGYPRVNNWAEIISYFKKERVGMRG